MTQTPEQILGLAWDDGNCVGLDGWVGPARGEPIDSEALRCRERTVEKSAAELTAAAAAKVLRAAADALELQPPKLRAQYVAALRLYADEPWRLKGEDA